MADQRPRLAHDPAVPRTVFVAPGRAARPIEIPGSVALAACPFCAGHEHLTPGEVLRLPASGQPSWSARVVPNRYPVVAGPDREPPAAASRDGHPADGLHEVLVESPRHDTCILSIDPSAWRIAWEACRRRLATFAAGDEIAWATVFKNSGPAAGASLAHVHSQLVGLGFIPPVVAAELACAVDDATLFSRQLADAVAENRVVATAGDLVAFVPRAPRQPYEVWIVPRAARPWFHADDAVEQLADLSRDVVGRILELEPGANYNWWLHQAPHAGPVPRGWHWHLEILPRLSGIAGFELATGCHITTAGTAESARRLRGAAAHFHS